MRKGLILVLVITFSLVFFSYCGKSEKKEENRLKDSFYLYLVYSSDFYNGLKSAENSERAVRVFEKYIKNIETISDNLKLLYKDNKEFFDTLNPEKIPQEFIEFKSYVKRLYDSLPDLAACIEKFENDDSFIKVYNKYKAFLKTLE